MKILFILYSLDVGGIEKVTVSLANKFAEEKHDVFVYCFSDRSKAMQNFFNKKVCVSFGHRSNDLKRNSETVRRIVMNNFVDVVINQIANSIIFSRTIYKACKGLNIKIVSVYHNAPNKNQWLQNIQMKKVKTNSFVKKALLETKGLFWKEVSSFFMRYAYNHSDCFFLLSKAYIPVFCDFTKIKENSKLLVQNNPLTISRDDYNNLWNKEKIILYVGRLEEGQKRVSRIFHFWKLLQPQLPEWKLVMVGDGPDRASYEQFVKDYGLQNVLFEGFQEPDSYYQKAPILVMTSDYEGWPLVLGECKAYGCVPIVLGSYLSVSELVDSENDGIIMPTPFDEKEWASKILSLAKTPERLMEMSLLAEKNSHKFDIDVIYKQWEEKINTLLNS